jgi:hypothetical protein
MPMAILPKQMFQRQTTKKYVSLEVGIILQIRESSISFIGLLIHLNTD